MTLSYAGRGTGAFDILKDNPHLETSWINSMEFTEDYHLQQGNTLSILRQISQDTIRNHYVGSAIQQAYVNAIVGGNLRTKISTTDPRDQATIDKYYDDETMIDISQTKTLCSINEELVAAAFSDGDCLINLAYDETAVEYTGFGLRVEIIEGCRIKTPPNMYSDPQIINGVHIDLRGVEVGYWVKRITPNSEMRFMAESPDNFVYVPAYNDKSGVRRRTAYLFKAQTRPRPNMVRQYPVMTPIFTIIKYMNSYLEAVLIGGRVSACFAGYIETANPAGTANGIATGKGDAGATSVKKINPGTITSLRRGDKMTFSSPNKPSDNFDTLLIRVCRFACASVRMSYEVVFQDLSVVNYSSWNGGKAEIGRNVARWTRELTMINRWILQNIILDLVFQNKLRTSLTNFDIQVRFPKYETLDPEKTARANKIALTNGTKSKHMICDEENTEYEEVQSELEAEAAEEIELEAERLKLMADIEKKEGIEFPELVAIRKGEASAQSGGRTTGKRAGEDTSTTTFD